MSSSFGSRFEAYMNSEKSSKKAARRTDLEDGLTKLDQLTDEGARMASAEVQRIANENVRGLRDGMSTIDETAPVARGDAQILSDNSINMVGRKMRRIVDGTQTWPVSH